LAAVNNGIHSFAGTLISADERTNVATAAIKTPAPPRWRLRMRRCPRRAFQLSTASRARRSP
jgi:hypothetical protein